MLSYQAVLPSAEEDLATLLYLSRNLGKDQKSGMLLFTAWYNNAMTSLTSDYNSLGHTTVNDKQEIENIIDSVLRN